MEYLRSWPPRPPAAVAGPARAAVAEPGRPAPKVVTPVKLSDLVRRKPPAQPAPPPPEPRAAAAVRQDARQAHPSPGKGFEIARGMITAAVKSELASCRMRGGYAAIGELESRLLTRISQIQAPFVA